MLLRVETAGRHGSSCDKGAPQNTVCQLSVVSDSVVFQWEQVLEDTVSSESFKALILNEGL